MPDFASTDCSKAYKIAPTTTSSSTANDAQLQTVIDAWATLPNAVKVGIVAMVEADKGEGREISVAFIA